MAKPAVDDRGDLDIYLTPTNRSPYNRNPFGGGLLPQTIYLYYWDNVEPSEEPMPRAYILEYPLPIRNKVRLRQLMREAAEEAANQSIKPTDTGFNTFSWERKSFVVIVVGDSEWSFANERVIAFNEALGWGNHTFFDAFHARLSITQNGVGRREVTALCFTNWMVDAYGNDLVHGPPEEFHFVLDPTGPRGTVRVPIDPGGNNLGPPIAPP